MVQEIVTRDLQQDKEICEFMLKIERDHDKRKTIQIRLNQINRELSLK